MPPRPPLISPGSGAEFLTPRQEGETAYAYRKRRSLFLTGQTPYERRIASAQARGIGRTAARGHQRSGETESQRRNRISVENFGLTVSQRRRAELTAWLTDNGYTPESTNMTWTQLLRLAARLRYMYNAVGPGGRVTPAMIADAIELENSEEVLEKGWAFERLWQKYDDMISYRETRNRLPGLGSWAEYQQVHPFIPSLAPQWWYYH
jgi:hypothetical protein